MDARRALACLAVGLAACVGALLWLAPGFEASGAQRDGRGDTSEISDGERELPTLDSGPAADESRATAGARDAPPEVGIAGRVLDVDSGAGLAGFQAKLWSTEGTLASVETDEGGWFQLPPPPARHGTVGVWPLSGWTVVEKFVNVEAREDQQYAQLVFHARASHAAKLRGRLFDEDTGEVVPHYVLDVGPRDSTREYLVSDADGVFETEHEFYEGAVRLTMHDVIPPDEGYNERKPCAVLDIPFDGVLHDPPIAVQLPVGPTYFMTLNKPDSVDVKSLTAMLLIGADANENVASSQITHGAFHQTPVHEDETPWARFSPRVRHYDQVGSPLNLAVRSRDGFWYGSASIDSTKGIYPRRVLIDLEGRGRIAGRVRDASGVPIGSATIAVRPLAPSDGVDRKTTTLSSGNGLFEFELLRAGRYLVTAISSDHNIASTEATVIAARQTEVDLTLTRAPVAGAVSGRFIFPIEPAARSTSVVIYSVNPAGRFFEQQVEFHADGGHWLGEFRFDDLPVGDYVVIPNGNYSWTPNRLRATPPARDLEFQAASSSRTRVQFFANDAVTGDAISPFLAAIEPIDPLWGVEDLELDWNWVHHDGAIDANSGWIVSAPGYAPVRGKGFEGPPDQPQVHAKLERGWGAEFVVLGPQFAPVAGVQIALDDSPSGATAADGSLRVARAAKPKRVTLTYRDWHVDPDSIDDLRAFLAGNQVRLEVFLAPP